MYASLPLGWKQKESNSRRFLWTPPPHHTKHPAPFPSRTPKLNNAAARASLFHSRVARLDRRRLGAKDASPRVEQAAPLKASEAERLLRGNSGAQSSQLRSNPPGARRRRGSLEKERLGQARTLHAGSLSAGQREKSIPANGSSERGSGGTIFLPFSKDGEPGARGEAAAAAAAELLSIHPAVGS